MRILRVAITMTPSDSTRHVDGLSIIEALPHLLLLTALFFTTFIARIILAPLLPTIEAELAIGHRSAGNLFFILSTGYFLSLLSTSSPLRLMRLCKTARIRSRCPSFRTGDC